MQIQPTSASASVPRTPTSSEIDEGFQNNVRLLSLLTDADKELVYQSTGFKLDPNKGFGPALAYQLAYDRQNGHISSNQQPSVEYFQSMLDSYRSHGVDNVGFETQLQHAIDYLRTQPRNGIDVNA